MAHVRKKVRPKIQPKSGAQAKGKRKKLSVPEKRSKGWAVIGFDTSLSSLAGAAIGYDATLDRMKGPAFSMRRWGPDDDYFSRILMSANAHEMVHDMLADLGLILGNDEIWIAQEEPWPPHSSFVNRGISLSLKQQAEISGAFLGGLVRWGYSNIFQVGNSSWRKLVADEITDAGIEAVTTHHTKWKSAKLAEIYNCAPKDSGKFRAHQWARHVFEPWIVQQGGAVVPEFPPMIHKKIDGRDHKVPRPENSKAKAFQPDDRYDALAIMAWMLHERANLTG